jgi:DNA-binding winged helix-turn-helix (wHTH) protein
MLLRHFIENPGRLIDRDEIMRTVWPGIFVLDDRIAQCVRDIRHALGDSRLQVLRRAPRRGYLFAAEVLAADAAAPAAPAVEEPAHDPATAARPSIAVLPFNNVSGDPEQEMASSRRSQPRLRISAGCLSSPAIRASPTRAEPST